MKNSEEKFRGFTARMEKKEDDDKQNEESKKEMKENMQREGNLSFLKLVFTCKEPKETEKERV